MTTVRGITSRVDIVWRNNGSEVNRIEGVNVTSTRPYLVLYKVYHTIPLLSTTDDGRVYQCKVVINTSPPTMATSNITLDVIGVF